VGAERKGHDESAGLTSEADILCDASSGDELSDALGAISRTLFG
jgi:hypothetical protein